MRTCWAHGGKAPASIRRLEKDKKEAEIADLAAKHAVPIDVSPLVGLRKQLAERYGLVAWLRAQVRQQVPEQLWRGTRGMEMVERTGFNAGTEKKTDVGPMEAVIWRQYLDAMSAYESLAVACVKLGISVAEVEIERAAGERFAQALGWMFGQLAPMLSVPQEDARAVFVAGLSMLTTGEPQRMPVAIAAKKR
jgi:hypothetical protein